MYYIKYFFLTSILGFLLEVIINGDSGILYGPYTPVYGIGCLIILLIFEKNKKRSINKYLKFIIIVTTSTLLLTLAELVGGLLIEKIFGLTFWDYTNKKYNIGKYICLEISSIWLIASILFLFFKPILDKVISRIPNIIIYLISVIFILDIITTITNRSKKYEKINSSFSISNVYRNNIT